MVRFLFYGQPDGDGDVFAPGGQVEICLVSLVSCNLLSQEIKISKKTSKYIKSNKYMKRCYKSFCPVFQEPKGLYESTKFVQLSKLDRNATLEDIKKSIRRDSEKLVANSAIILKKPTLMK